MTASHDELTVHLVRALPAPPPLIFRMHTDPDELARWFGPKGFSAAIVAFDLRVGGTYRIEMQPPEGDRFLLVWEFRRIDPFTHLTFTFRYEDPDPDDQDTLVALSFVDRGDATELTVDQGPFLTEARSDLHARGWSESVDRLYNLAANRRPR